MSYDLFAHHPIHNRGDAQRLSRDLDPYTRIMLFAQALLSSDHKESVRGKQYKNELKKLVNDPVLSLLANLNLDTPQGMDLSILPFGSFFISFKFQLTRPYISRDDEPFYIIDNPLVKEKVFKVPIVRPSSWKGALRAAIRLIKVWDANRPELLALFGTANDDQPKDRKRGRLWFYPTYFNNIDREVINPHDREKKAGKKPIYFESVPLGATGTFTLLYVPLNRIGEYEAETRDQVAKDLGLVAEGLQAMFTVYGFGAKTSSGFGVAQENLVGQGQLQIKADISLPTTIEPAPTPPTPDLPRYLSAPNQLHADFQADEDSGLISEAEYQKRVEGRGKKYTKPYKQLYAKAKGWWEREGQALTEAETPQVEPPTPIETLLEKWPPQPFNSFSALVHLADEVAEALKQGGRDE